MGEPSVALGDRAVVHVVVDIGNQECDSRQVAIIDRQSSHRAVIRLWNISERDPRRVLARIRPRRTNDRTGRRQRLGVAGERHVRREQFAAQVWCLRRDAPSGAPVAVRVRNAGEQSEIIGKTRMRDAVCVREERSTPRDLIDERSRRATIDLRERLILLDDYDNMRGAGQRCSDRCDRGNPAGRKHNGNGETYDPEHTVRGSRYARKTQVSAHRLAGPRGTRTLRSIQNIRSPLRRDAPAGVDQCASIGPGFLFGLP